MERLGNRSGPDSRPSREQQQQQRDGAYARPRHDALARPEERGGVRPAMRDGAASGGYDRGIPRAYDASHVRGAPMHNQFEDQTRPPAYSQSFSDPAAQGRGGAPVGSRHYEGVHERPPAQPLHVPHDRGMPQMYDRGPSHDRDEMRPPGAIDFLLTYY